MGFWLKDHGFANGLGVGSKWVNGYWMFGFEMGMVYDNGYWVWDTRVMGKGSRERKRNNTTTKMIIQY